MRATTFFAIAGALVAAGMNILFNLIAAAIQKRAFNDQFNDQSIWWLAGLVVVGLVAGYVLGILATPHTNTTSNQSPRNTQSNVAQSGSETKSPKYDVQAEYIGAVGENNTVTTTINNTSSKDKKI